MYVITCQEEEMKAEWKVGRMEGMSKGLNSELLVVSAETG